jgi:DNA-binding response OmpR family regulator
MALIPKILVVSDLQTTSPLWAFTVIRQRLNVILETNPANMIERWAQTLPDMVVLDIDSESLAIELITKLRDQAVLPILLLTSIRSEKFMLEAYQAGLDEFVLKPIHPTLFDVKIQAWLRHSWNIPGDMLESLRVGSFHLVPSNRALELDGSDPIHLTNLELRLLYYLMARPGHTLTTKELCQHVWGHWSEGDAATLKNLVYRLRHKIEADPAHPHYVYTVVGVGYQFIAN